MVSIHCRFVWNKKHLSSITLFIKKETFSLHAAEKRRKKKELEKTNCTFWAITALFLHQLPPLRPPDRISAAQLFFSRLQLTCVKDTSWQNKKSTSTTSTSPSSQFGLLCGVLFKIHTYHLSTWVPLKGKPHCPHSPWRKQKPGVTLTQGVLYW